MARGQKNRTENVMLYCTGNKYENFLTDSLTKNRCIYRDYFMVGECVRFLFTSCEGSLNERVSAANE